MKKFIVILTFLLIAGLIFPTNIAKESRSLQQCYMIDGPDIQSKVVNRGSKVWLSGTISNCSNSSRRMYFQFSVTSSCGQELVVFASSAKTYRAWESKYSYINWQVPKWKSLSMFSDELVCTGQATVRITLFEKSFWGRSKYLSSSSRTITIK